MNDVCRKGLKDNIIKIISKNIRSGKLISPVHKLAELITDEAEKYSDAFIKGCLV